MIREKPNGSLRLCLNPQDLSSNISRRFHEIPSIEEISAHLNGKKFFTVLDLKQGFWHIELDKESSEACTVECFKLSFH